MLARGIHAWLCCLILIGSLCGLLREARPQAGLQRGPVDAAQVRGAIEQGVEFLRKRQNNGGSWNGHPEQPGGVTALCVLALLNSGVPADDPQIVSAMNYLRALKPEKVYASALIVMACSAADAKQNAGNIKTHALWLESKQVTQGALKGGWAYDEPNGRPDNSNTQFAILGLHEAERARVNVVIKNSTWANALSYWTDGQNNDGSWGYFNSGQAFGRDLPGTGSMTCAGVASVTIAQARLSGEEDAKLDANGISCCRIHKTDTSVERGLTWLGKHFTVRTNPSSLAGAGVGWTLYYLYGIERIGRLTGRRFFYGNQGRPHDWYREGAEHLVRNQSVADGRWVDNNDSDGIDSTCLALLFLSKGRRPVVIAKAKYGNDNAWNRHRNDAANLTTFVEQAWKREFPIGLSWQVVDLERATLEDLLQSPVLYLSGSKTEDFAADKVQLLRDYIDRGGFIFVEACCENGPDFDKSFRATVQKMFADKPEHQLKLLGPEHPIWRAELPVPPEAVRPIWGVDYGCRTCLVYVPSRKASDPPGNLGCWWELNTWRKTDFSPTTFKQINGAYAIGVNVLAYATNRELKSKDENLNLKIDQSKPATDDRALVYIAKLKHNGGCDTAPGALPGILRAAKDQLDFRVAVEPRLIDIASDSIFDYHFVFMHGRSGFKLTPAERKRLREYVERGGTIFADSICSSKAFSDAFRQEMQEIFPQTKLAAIPANHVMLTKKYGGFDLSQVARREPSGGADQPLDARKRVGPPELEGIQVGDRYGVIFSKYDLSCALERHDSLECEGYSRDDAERISMNVLLYSLVH